MKTNNLHPIFQSIFDTQLRTNEVIAEASMKEEQKGSTPDCKETTPAHQSFEE